MTDYQRIDWSKLPELPDGLLFRLLGNELQVLKCGVVRSYRLDHDGSEWKFFSAARGPLEKYFAATDIIDRFIAEQEAELTKPKPRRVTPKELLVELIQNEGNSRCIHTPCTPDDVWSLVSWERHKGLRVCWKEHKSWRDFGLEHFYNFTHFDVIDTPTEPPKPRLPVKTKAPEGYAWELDRHGNVVLRQVGTESTWGLVERSVRRDIRGRAIREIAIVDASEELNP